MIQRVQSIYLLLVVILIGVLFVSPLGILIGSEASDAYSVTACGISSLEGSQSSKMWGVLTIGGLIGLIAFVEIFLYKRRQIQIRLSQINLLLLLFFYVTLGVYICSFVGECGHYTLLPSYGVVLPVIAFVFNLLALFRIKADEKLIRSLDRIR